MTTTMMMDFDELSTSIVDADEKKDRKKARMNFIRVSALAILILSVIGLGVGLGIGLKPKPVPPSEVQACYSTFNRVENQHEIKKEPIKSCPSASSLVKCPKGKNRPPLIVVSLDGFRADYLLRNMTPNLDMMSKCGVHAPYMRATFPTKTFPNHYTIATGLYTESHGIIDNFFYDLESNRTFSLRTDEVLDKKWYHGEPIWNTAKKAGKKVLAMMWPGSAVDVQDMRPDDCYIYDKNLGFRGRVEEVLTYFNPEEDPSTHPDLVFIYLEQPDAAGHDGGPYSHLVHENLTKMDDLIGRLVNGIMDSGYKDCVNFVVVADHGMDQARCKSAVNISEHLDMNKYFAYTGFHSRITSKYLADSVSKILYPNPNPVPVEETMKKLSCTTYNSTKDWHLRVHMKEDLPKRYHYSNNDLISEIVFDIQPGFVVQDFRDSNCNLKPGGHGSDNTFGSMHAIFVAMGSSFKQQVVEPFENIELYNLFSDLAGVQPAPNNGTYGRLHFIIKGTDKDVITVDPMTVNYKTCLIPESLVEIIRIRNQSRFPPLSSSCFSGMTEDNLNKNLNLTQTEMLESLIFNLPLECPGSKRVEFTCKLIQKKHITAFNDEFHMPLWTSFTLQHNKSSNSNVLNADWISDKNKAEGCVRADVRITNMPDYSRFENQKLGIKKAFLYPPGFARSSQNIPDSHTSSNVVPMFKCFEAGVWKEMIHLIEEYSEKYGRINVLLGPIFDHNSDGLADSWDDIKMFVDEFKSVALPSHYFVVLTKCKGDNSTCLESLETISFVLPHKDFPGNCWEKRVDNYLRENVARIRDVELLTGLSLLNGLKDKEKKTRLLTFLAEEIWPRLSWLDTEPDSCPKFSSASKNTKRHLLLVSLDGFRPDYLDRGLTPTLSRLSECGSTHSSMTSVYPSMTFPNHFSISTGLYPESHGIVDNKMYDMSLNESFFLDSTTALNSHWWNAEPIWSRVVESNGTAMVLYWPGSDVEILGKRPTDYEPYSDVAPSQFRVNKVLDWLDAGADLIGVYFVLVDNAGHEGGPDSIQVNETLVEADKFMQALMDGIFRKKLNESTDIVVLSDHGMARIYSEKEIHFDEYLSEENLDKVYIYETASPRISTRYSGEKRTMIPVDEDKRASKEDIVSNLTCKANMWPYLKEECPTRFHYSNNDRIDEILLFLDQPWLGKRNADWSSTKGYHGWDPLYEHMRALFIGWGPSFKEKAHFNESFDNIELYNLFTHLLDIHPAPNNGTWGSLHHLLRSPPTNFTVPPSLNCPSYDKINGCCSFPQSDEDLSMASNHTLYECPTNKYDYQRLNWTSEDKECIEKKHISHGMPYMHVHNLSDVCLLHQYDFVSAYNKKLRLPLWSAFKPTFAQVCEPANYNIAMVAMNWSFQYFIPDVRVSPSSQPNCRHMESLKQNISFVPLVHPDVPANGTSEDALLLTNVVPMHKTFIKNVWTLAINKLIRLFPSGDFILGPIFDRNNDGLVDSTLPSDELQIPTHYFVIALENKTNGSFLESASFVFPNSVRDAACRSIEQHMQTYRTRIRDIELLTGLKFLTINETWDSVRSRTYISTKNLA